MAALRGKRVSVLGYTFKRDADDVRDSLAPKLIRYIEREAPAKIVVSDPFITADAVECISGLEFTPNMDAALVGADVVFIATNHTLYERESDKIAAAARLHGACVVDIWNICGLGRVTFDREALRVEAPLKLRRSAA